MKPAVFLLVLGCAPDEPAPTPPPQGPAGTVLFVDGLPLTAAEVEPLGKAIRELYPEYSLVHARRIALTNEILPRLAARAREPERWKEARAACERALDDGNTAPLALQQGTFRALGLTVWSSARHLPIGAWSDPVDVAGRWLRLRLDERTEHADPRQELLRVSVLEFPYLDRERDPLAVEAAIDCATLTVLDPEFCEAVPEAWRHRMRGDEP
jgi:hypothetical protein